MNPEDRKAAILKAATTRFAEKMKRGQRIPQP
jgi:hypothetical protein